MEYLVKGNGVTSKNRKDSETGREVNPFLSFCFLKISKIKVNY